VSSLTHALAELVGHQRQLDMDGTFVGVSRQALDEVLFVMLSIEKLREHEGDSVTLLCDNPEGPPNNAIVLCGAWSDWKDMRVEGETLLGALQEAVKNKAEREGER
jgi:hypothetical protein